MGKERDRVKRLPTIVGDVVRGGVSDPLPCMKVGYRTGGDALEARPGMRAYFCVVCGRHHVTSKAFSTQMGSSRRVLR